MYNGMLGKDETLRQVVGGPVLTLLSQLNGKEGENVLAELNKFNRHEPCWPPRLEQYFRPPFEVFYLKVPDNYYHPHRLKKFRKSVSGERLGLFDEKLNDQDARSTDQLIPGKIYTVKLIPVRKQIELTYALAFLKSNDAFLVGAQGLSLVYELHRDRMVESWSMVSLTDLEHLPNGPGPSHVYDGKVWPIMKVYDDQQDSFICSRGDGDVLSDQVMLVCFFNEDYSWRNDPDRDDD